MITKRRHEEELNKLQESCDRTLQQFEKAYIGDRICNGVKSLAEAFKKETVDLLSFAIHR
jgi:hypothetical protein